LNPLGVHALVWTQSWTESDCARAISLTKETGFDFIEVPLLDPAGIDVAMTRGMLESHEVEATCSLGLSFETDVSSEDPTVAARGEALLNRAVDVTAGIGARYLGGVVHSAMAKYKSPATEDGRARCADILHRVAERALDAGVTIGIEAVNRYESNVINTAAQAMSLIDRVNQPNMVVHLDTYHMNIEEGDLARPVAECRERLGYVHIGESHRGYLGSGTVDFARFFRALTEAGYDGPIAFESFSSSVISDEFCSALAVWRDLWIEGESLARHARSFVEDGLIAAQQVRR